MTWRDKAAPIIAKVIAETGTDDMRLLRKKLRKAFPWGEYGKNYHPTKIWRDEIRRQLFLKPLLRHGGRKPELEGMGYAGTS